VVPDIDNAAAPPGKAEYEANDLRETFNGKLDWLAQVQHDAHRSHSL
jgi:hypothetical protein